MTVNTGRSVSEIQSFA